MKMEGRSNNHASAGIHSQGRTLPQATAEPQAATLAGYLHAA